MAHLKLRYNMLEKKCQVQSQTNIDIQLALLSANQIFYRINMIDWPIQIGSN